MKQTLTDLVMGSLAAGLIVVGALFGLSVADE